MIIQIRGTSGSGKTTLVRNLLDECMPSPVQLEGRKQPAGYLCEPEGLFVPGHYNTPCGGCDTIPKYDLLFDLIREYHHKDYQVVFEGLLVSGDKKRTLALHREFPGHLHVIALNTPTEECLASINARRRAKDPEAADVNPANTLAKVKAVSSAMRTFEEEGVHTYWRTRHSAARLVRQLLGLRCNY